MQNVYRRAETVTVRLNGAQITLWNLL